VDSDPLIVGLEGPSDSGKSTLAAALARIPEWQPTRVLRCYADTVDAGDLPPHVAGDVGQQLEAVAFFMTLDRQRRREIEHADERPKVVIADRTWLSLLAHTYAVERAGGPAAYAEARRRLTADKSLLRPDLVLVLRANVATRTARMASGDRGAWFTSPAFNAHFDRFFSEEARSLVPRVVDLDANRPASEIANAAVAAIGDRGCTS
jgi:thymidylate kinase